MKLRSKLRSGSHQLADDAVNLGESVVEGPPGLWRDASSGVVGPEVFVGFFGRAAGHPETEIVSYLESSGYKADSALGQSDLRELGKLLRADEVLGGTVTRTPTGIRVEPRLMLACVSSPLPSRFHSSTR